MNSIKNILIYRLGSLGDTIIALPTFRAIRKAFPEAHITILTNKPVASKAAAVESILSGTGLFNDILNYPVATRNPLILLNLIKKLRKKRLNAVFNLTAHRNRSATLRDWIFCLMTGAKYLHGFDFLCSGESGLQKFANGELEWEASTIARRVLPVVKVDLNSEDSWDLGLTDQEISEAEKLLSPIIEKESPIVFSTGTKLQTNHWGMNNWINLLSDLSMKLSNQPAIFLGSHDEISESEACKKAWNGLFLNLCGKTTPRVAAAILKRSKLFIGHDSGPMHLASCVGTPCVAIFSARNLPAQWFPRGKNNTIIYHKTECAGCGLEVCITQKKKCITSISVEEVYKAIIDKLMHLGQN